MKKFKLSSSLSANNMVMFDANQRIRKYDDECQIMEEYFPIRYKLYVKRKAH